LFGDEVLNSPFQDGHYIYQVLPGYGAGSQTEAPTLFIADLENPSQLHIILKPSCIDTLEDNFENFLNDIFEPKLK
jgi:hypothetical protein